MSDPTPGPWKVRRHERGQVEIVTGDGTSNVAIVHGLSLRPDGDPETDANATLIASAPELLAALRNVTDLAAATSLLGEDAESVKRARAAIARAEGKVRP